jgi:DNA-binding response OmpR family regulator
MSWQGTSRTLDVHIATLRGKIGEGAQIETIRGVGYRIVPGPNRP